jgi:hypothetical protein
MAFKLQNLPFIYRQIEKSLSGASPTRILGPPGDG